MHRRRSFALTSSLAAFSALGLALSGCTPVVDLSPAPDSANPACAPMMIALPDKLADQQLRDTSSQGTAAWGNPSKVVLRCGVNAPPPTKDPCVGVNGIDWVSKQDPANPDTWTFTTYGREPATAILFNQNDVASSTVLAQLAAAVGKIPQTRKCLGPADAQLLPVSPSIAP